MQSRYPLFKTYTFTARHRAAIDMHTLALRLVPRDLGTWLVSQVASPCNRICDLAYCDTLALGHQASNKRGKSGHDQLS